MIGHVVGKYKVREKIGEGGMGVVYRAEHLMLSSAAAIKILLPQFTTQPSVVEGFFIEAKATSQIRHPGIVQIFDYGRLDDDRAYIVMELLRGETLTEFQTRRGVVDPSLSVQIAVQLLSALEAAHARKIVHRDIKLSNMMRAPDGRVKLMDFGLAKSLSDRRKTSFIAGTPAYMAPEHLRGEELDARADLFAIAVSLYEMLSGELPYAGLDRNAAPVPLEERVPAVPPSLAEAVMKGLAPDRRDRWASAEQMVQPIAQILEAVARFAGGVEAPIRRAAEPATAATAVLHTKPRG